MRSQVFSLLVDNNSGVLSRISGLFSRRGYSIDSITAGMTADPRFTRITIVSSGDEQILSQIEKQLRKLEDVVDIKALKAEESVCRELIMVKLRANAALGGAIALQMLLDIPIIWGSVLTTVFVSIMLFTNSYKKIERAIIAFVSVIGLSFIYELFLVRIDWPVAVQGWVTPSFPQGSMLIIMSVLGAVVMPHNLFLHSEVIQSHEYNKKDDASIRRVLKYELFDTLFSMIVGWAINSAMILLAAATFFKGGIQVEELQQAKSLLDPLLGSSAGVVFALALLMAGISSTITSGMAAGSIFAGIFGESYHIRDSHSQVGVILSLGIALLLICFIGDPFKGLLISQMILSIQLPFTVFLQVSLTSSRKVMGQYVNSKWSTFVLYTIAAIVTVLNIMLLISSL